MENERLKTVGQFLQQAKIDGYDWADEAIKHCESVGWMDNIPDSQTLSCALCDAFFWRDTGDVRKWAEIYNKLEYLNL